MSNNEIQSMPNFILYTTPNREVKLEVAIVIHSELHERFEQFAMF